MDSESERKRKAAAENQDKNGGTMRLHALFILSYMSMYVKIYYVLLMLKVGLTLIITIKGYPPHSHTHTHMHS